jgi:hypothetical protein
MKLERLHDSSYYHDSLGESTFYYQFRKQLNDDLRYKLFNYFYEGTHNDLRYKLIKYLEYLEKSINMKDTK